MVVNESQLIETQIKESVEDAFPSGKLTTLGAIKADISWRKSQIKEKNYEIHGN